ncbi:MAG TPA: hypothetical protein VFC51_05965, partial [Chloroflexota bacterium]|nr:hypothetical protein [Chloroflexota bacterium]
GNTRCAAARRNRYEHIAAYICSDLSPLQARALSVELNQSHGLGMTEEELRAFVLSAVQEGHSFDTRSYARMTGVTASKLSKWVACARFHIRAQRCGIPQADVALLSESKQATLNAARLRCVFMEATLLAVAARLPVAQLKRLVAAANDAPSEAEALAIVAGERQAREEEIAAVARGFTSGLRRRTRPASMHVAALLKTDADKLLDVMPEAHSETFEALSALQRHIAAVLAEAARRWGMPTASSGGSPTVASGVPAHA